MVDKIYEVKNEVLKQIDQDMREKGAGRIDPEMVDMVKDLAEAEKACWEAEYYRSVSEAMQGQQGYMPDAMNDNMRQGYRWANQYGSGTVRRGYSTMGHTDAIGSVRDAMQMATPEEKERMKQELRSMMQ